MPKWTLTLLGLALAVVVLTAGWLAGTGSFHRRDEHRVILREDGFHPNELTIQRGEKIIFSATGEKPYWPASDFHPSHTLYPEFDPQRAINPGETWSFTFDRTGEWSYHDHYAPYRRGVVMVVERGGSATEIIDPCSAAERPLGYQEKARCFMKEVDGTLKTQGLDEAFTHFAELYDREPLFRAACHDVTHLLGYGAYREFRKGREIAITPKTSYCGYGFYHGFIEAMRSTAGDFREAREFCNRLRERRELAAEIQSPNAIYSCYHGIGHGAFDYIGPRLLGDERAMVGETLRACDSLANEAELKKQCATGVFNSLANAYGAGSYELTFPREDPLLICRAQEGRNRKACFTEVTLALIRHRGLDFPGGIDLVSSIAEAEGAAGAILGYITDEVRLAISKLDLSDFGRRCQGLGERLRRPCIEGVAIALMGWGLPGEEHRSLLEFCRLPMFGESERRYCFGYVLPRLGTLYSRGKTQTLCRAIEEKYRDLCVVIQ